MAVQRRAARPDDAPGSTSADDAVPGKATQIEALAARGVSGTPGALPFADQIATSFGPAHADTVRSIGAHTGGAATAASEDIGAVAYATGDQVAFAGAPDLHTAAHEAAHVVQQRQGVSLKGGVGAAGDRYEQHADAVADRVVRGESAADLLGARGAGGDAAVQRKEPPKHKPSAADEKKAHEEFEADGPSVVYALTGIFWGNKDMAGYMPNKYAAAAAKFWKVVHPDKLDGRERVKLYDEVYPIFEPFASASAHFDGPDDNLSSKMKTLRASMFATEATDRVDNSVMIVDGNKKQAIEMPDDGHPREQAEVLGMTLPKLVSGMKTTIERAKTLGESTGVSKEMLERLETAVHVLTLAEGFLKLNDEEFQKELTHIKGVMHGVSTYSELVKTVLEMGSSSIALTCKASALLMKAVGDHAMAEACEHTGAMVSAALGKVVAAIEIVHGVSVLFDSHASTDDRIGGAIEIAAGVATLGAGTSLAALPIMGPYALIKGAQYLYSEAVIGWETGVLREVFKNMANDARIIGQAMDGLGKAQLLLQDEKDPERRAAMAVEETKRANSLRLALSSFLHGTEHVDHGSDWELPGNIEIIAERFVGPRNHLAEAHTTADVSALADEVMKNMVWVFKHGPAIVQGMATHKHVEDMDALEDKLEGKDKKE